MRQKDYETSEFKKKKLRERKKNKTNKMKQKDSEFLK